MNVELTDDERGVVAGVLDEALRDLKEEIYKTETYDYKEQLKARERIMIAVLNKVNQGVSASADAATPQQPW